MTFLLTLIYFIFIMGIIVFIHEFGHFIFAKKFGVYCYEFSIGMGPKIYSFKRKNDETTYSIRLFPIGGYVSMAGEEVEVDENIPLDKRMQSKKWYQRVLIVTAGVIMNFLLAFILLIVVGLLTSSPISNTTISKVDSNNPAYQSGLKKGDKIVSVEGKKVKNVEILSLELQTHKGKAVDLGIIRDNEKQNIKVKPSINMVFLLQQLLIKE